MNDKPLLQPVMQNDAGEIVATFPDLAGMTADEIESAIKDAIIKGEKIPGHWAEGARPHDIVKAPMPVK